MGSLSGQNDTKLHEAVRYYDIEEVEEALRERYDPNQIGLYQWTPLHEAAHNGAFEILQFLLKYNGDPNKPDYLQGYTSVHYAAKLGHLDCLKLLVSKGGLCDILSKDKKKPVDLATEECKNYLLSLDKTKESTNLLKEDSLLKLYTEVEQRDTRERQESCQEIGDKIPSLGYLHLSFEYHAKKNTFRIRVWQLTDLLLPPASTSMIHSIYVKSYLMPDKKKDSKRKTEEIKVDNHESHMHVQDVTKGSKGSVQHVYKPSHFKFSKALEYNSIDSGQVQVRSVQLEVCITQKYSKKSFLVGLHHMPLKEAVKKIVKEKYPLIPCMNQTIPKNMKVYSASELDVLEPVPVFYSNPGSRNSFSDLSLYSDVAVSNPDLQCVDSPRSKLGKLSPSVSLKLSDESDEIKSHKEQSIVIPIDKDNHKSAFSEYKQQSKEQKVIKKNNEDLKGQMPSGDTPNASRPDTPSWDYYDLDVEVVDIPVSEESSHDPTTICLPMETTMGIKPSKHHQKHAEKKKGHHSGHTKTKHSQNLDVPQIIITSTDVNKSESKINLDPVTPRNVMLNVEDDDDTLYQSNKCDRQSTRIEVIADIHASEMERLDNDTSIIEIRDFDSFVIDVEDMSEHVVDSRDILDMEQVLSKASSIIPKSVFIDETYDSCDDSDYRIPSALQKNI